MIERRFLHTMIRVTDLDRSIDFYTRVMGMKLLRKKEYPAGEFTLAFLGYQDEAEGHVLELTYNWDGRKYKLGTAFGHLAVSAPDLYELCANIEESGGRVVRPPGPMKHGGSEIAFVEDPDGYKIELIKRS